MVARQLKLQALNVRFSIPAVWVHYALRMLALMSAPGARLVGHSSQYMSQVQCADERTRPYTY
jgi:hypothetical protein